MDSAQGNDLAPNFGDSIRSEKVSEIKPPLIRSKMTWPNVCPPTFHYVLRKIIILSARSLIFGAFFEIKIFENRKNFGQAKNSAPHRVSMLEDSM